MHGFHLPIFPEGALSASVITTVWVGVWIVAFFNLRLGWTFSGLVVPGYMVPIFMAKPWSGAILIVEGILTYFIVWLASERLARVGFWSSLFGRDRYFALLLTSIPVRAVFDAILLPALGQWLNDRFHVEFDYENNLHSFGLILIPLIANQFWKTGLRRGLGPMAVTIGLTYLIIRFVLMEFTNFSVGNLQYMYETLATDLFASPKAYMITLTAAFVASRMNMYYSWEYHGIHIPALLALQWFEPIKILSTFVEAGIVYILAGALLHAPWFRSQNFEGARKVLLFFNVAFAYKMAVGFFCLKYLPTVKITDYYGFGYMLSTLMAVKSHEKGIPFRLTRATLQVSTVGALAGTCIGFVLMYLVPRAWSVRPGTPPPREVAWTSGERLVDYLRRKKVALYQKKVPGSVAVPSVEQLDAFTRGVEAVIAYGRDRDAERLDRARDALAAANYQLEMIQERYLCLRENPPERGWGLYVLDLQHPHGLAVEVPAPLDEWATLDAGLLLFQKLDGRALALAGSGRKTNRDTTSDALLAQRTIFQAFHRVAGRRDVVQVRGYTEEAIRALAGVRPQEGDLELPEIDSGLWVKSALPPGLNLAILRDMAGPYQIHWHEAPFPNVQREATPAEFAELFLSRADRRVLLGKTAVGLRGELAAARIQEEEGDLSQRLLEMRLQIAEAGTNAYRPATQEDLLYFDEEVLTPLLKIVRIRSASGRLSAKGEEELQPVAQAASLFGYRLVRFRDRRTDTEALILAEPDASAGREPADPAHARRNWGTCVFRLGRREPYLIQVPRPLFEQYSYEFGVALFERLQASVFVTAGAHPNANQDNSADLLSPRNKLNLAFLAAQVVLREARDRPLLFVQSRAFGVQETGVFPDADVLLAWSEGNTKPESLSALGRPLYDVLARDKMVIRFVDGAADVMGYEATGVLQFSYLAATRNKEMVLVWLSPLARTSYRQQIENNLLDAQVGAVGIPTVEGDLFDYLAQKASAHGSPDVPAALRGLLEDYLRSQDVIALYRLVVRGKAFRFERLLDPGTQQAYLLFYGPKSQMPLVASLAPRATAGPTVVTSAGVSRERVREFVATRATWLEVKGTR
jgi:hypothetical protein